MHVPLIDRNRPPTIHIDNARAVDAPPPTHERKAPSDPAATYARTNAPNVASIDATSAAFRTVSAPLLARNLGASSSDIVAAVDALVHTPGSSIADELRTILNRAAAKLDLIGAPDARLAADAAKVAALFAVLEKHTKDGVLDLASLSRAGATPALIAALITAAARPPPTRTNFTFLAKVVDSLSAVVDRRSALAVVDRFLRDDSILPRSVPGLTQVIAAVRDDRFADEGVVAVQHLLPTSLAFFEGLIAKGMRPDRIHVLGTPYASNPLVVSALRLLGVDAQGGTDNATSTVWFEEHRIEEIHEWLLRRGKHLLENRPPGGYQILDDGGLLQIAVAGGKLPRAMGERTRATWIPLLERIFPPGTRAVEQTTRGITELNKNGPRFCTVAVALAEVKRREGEVIGYALVEALLRQMAQRGVPIEKDAPVVVVSAGVVGLETAKCLRDAGFKVTVVDTDDNKRANAGALGFKTAPLVDRELAKDQAVILSCTGKTAMSGDALVDFDGLLCSGSSMAIEFNVEQVNAFRSSPVHAVNRARPLNFEGDGHENLTPAQIGIPRALNFAALAQEHDASKPGFVDVDHALQKIAVEAWEKAGGHRVPSLADRRISHALRPDALCASASARHDEWMAFLSGLERPVCPRPTTAHFTPGVYFFEDESGAVRMVDTSGDGKSRAMKLPSVPRTAAYVETALPGVPLLVECPIEDDRIALFEVEPTSARIKCVGEADRVARVSVADHRSLSTGLGKVELGFSFFDGDALLVRRPGTPSFVRVPLPAGVSRKDAIVVWPHKDTLLVVDKNSGAVHPLAIEKGSMFAQIIGRHARTLPPGLVSITAVGWWERQKTSVLVGRDADGRVAITMLTPMPSKKLALLPEGAVFRGLRPIEDDAGQKVWGRFRVDYTLPGDPIEVEHYRHVVVDWYEEISAQLGARP